MTDPRPAADPLDLDRTEKGRIAAALPILERELPAILRDFYAWIDTVPELRPIMAKSGRDTRDLAKAQYDHWMGLLRNGPDAAFAERAARIGRAHHRIGLSPHWYVAGYTYVLRRLNAVLARRHRFSGAETAATLSALAAALMFDMQAAIGVYADSGAAAQGESVAETIANDMMDSSVAVSVAVNEAAIETVRMLNAVEQVDRQAQGISAAVEETVTGIKRISETTDSVAGIAQQAEARARDGAGLVGEVAQRMEAITQVVGATSSLVNDLAASSREIGEIVKTIDDIAGQTNLLALNATIEAARAGEAGKGFAVVANEVKSLSTQTGRATEEIRGRIARLLEELDHIVASMGEADGAVAGGREAMGRASDAIEALSGDVADVSGRMEEIAAILQEQSAASDEVAEGVARIATESGGTVSALGTVSDSMRAVETQIGGQLQHFLQHDVPHKVLRIAKADHVIWKKRLADMLAGKEALRADELADHTKCRLGKFYYGPDAARYRALPAFKALEEPHRAVHAHGIAAVEHYNAGRMDEAFAQVAKVEDASARVLELLGRVVDEAGGAGFGKDAAF